jgi:cadmium resistance protein CadD (predicted permease)
MNGLMSAVGVAVAVYASTNIDNLLVLSLFFADRQLRPRSIVVGSFLGAAVVAALSVIVGVGARALPAGYVSILGVLPLALGLQRLHSLWTQRGVKETGAGADAEGASRRSAMAGRTAYAQTLAVAGVGIANSGDNLAAYVALFARSPEAIPGYLLVFLILTALWCSAGYWFSSNRMMGEAVRRVGRLAFPFVMLALAAWILSGTRVFFT